MNKLLEEGAIVMSISHGKFDAKAFFVRDDGWRGFGEYVDEFIFSPNPSKLSAVYMFENKHF